MIVRPFPSRFDIQTACRRAARVCAAFGVLAIMTACGIGKLDKGDHKDQASAQMKAVQDAYASKNKAVALPKGGPGKGNTGPALTHRSDAGPGGEDQPKTLKRRIGEFLRLVMPRRNVAFSADDPPRKMRGLYSLGDGADYFIPCGDTARFAVQATTEARYLLIERMRFIVRGMKTPVYAVFTATEMKPPPPPQPKKGQAANAPAAQPKPFKKSIYVTKVDSLTNAVPASCRTSGTGSRAASSALRQLQRTDAHHSHVANDS
ncbi:MAG: hypothetical protein U0163_16455 [Gemmatimonadaceae bacterium]